jgi:hypothetical protein
MGVCSDTKDKIDYE